MDRLLLASRARHALHERACRPPAPGLMTPDKPRLPLPSDTYLCSQKSKYAKAIGILPALCIVLYFWFHFSSADFWLRLDGSNRVLPLLGVCLPLGWRFFAHPCPALHLPRTLLPLGSVVPGRPSNLTPAYPRPFRDARCSSPLLSTARGFGPDGSLLSYLGFAI